MKPHSAEAYAPQSFQGLTYHDRQAAFRAGEDSPRAYLERCLVSIETHEPIVHAWACFNILAARIAADESSARWKAGMPLSPIDGMPLGIKDLLETKDMPTEFGCDALKGNFPKRDNAAVWALRRAGAVILGKTVTAELGGSHPGPTVNPFDSRRTPGGSSSGSAAAVAARMVPAAIGTQVGGSILRPSSFCGNFALKPTQGAINRGERQATTQSSHGVHAASIEDMWLVAIAIAARAGGDPGRLALQGPAQTPAAHKPFCLAVLETDGWDELAPEPRATFERFIERLRQQGVTVLRRQDDRHLNDLEQALSGAQACSSAITGWENRWTMRNLVDLYPVGISDRSKAVLAAAEAMTVEQYGALLARKNEISRLFAHLAPTIDALVTLGAPDIAPFLPKDVPGKPAPRPTGNSVFNVPASLFGAPAINLPLLALEGLPLGIQIVGQPHSDARLTAIGRWMSELYCCCTQP